MIHFQAGKEAGKVFKNQVIAVKPTDKKHKAGDYCFEVHHSASGSPWILNASTQVRCPCCLRILYSLCSPKFIIHIIIFLGYVWVQPW